MLLYRVGGRYGVICGRGRGKIKVVGRIAWDLGLSCFINWF